MGVRHRSRRIFLGPIEIAGFFSALESGFRERGITADFLDTSSDPFGYGRYARWLRARRSGTGPVNETLGRLRRGILRIFVFIWGMLRYDTFVIGGTGFWSGRELRILKWLNKRVIWVFLGSDHRPPYLNGKVVRRHPDIQEMRRSIKRTANRVRRVERWADEIVAHEASAQFHRRPFVRLLELGLPIQIDNGKKEAAAERPGGVVRIVHCPTDPLAKGSMEIRSVVEAIAASGIPVEYRELSGRPRDQVLKALAIADLVVDELFGDTPLGVLAAEAGWLGTASVCGGYFADGQCQPLADGTNFPVAFVTPDSIEPVLKRLVLSADERDHVAMEAHRFVRSRWTPNAVAQRMHTVIEGEVPQDWMVDPFSVGYVDGYGMLRSERVAAVSELIGHGGVEALGLEHRPDLVARLTG